MEGTVADNVDPVINPTKTGGVTEGRQEVMNRLTPPRVYLTFDDGPYPATAEVLNALRTAQVKATFFLCAKNLEKNGELQFKLIKRMIAEGHSLGNHGYDHDPATKAGYRSSTTDAVKKDFTDNVEKLKNLFIAHKDSFPDFDVARLPGDGRTFEAFVRMIIDEVGVPHAGWDFEFADNGRMKHVSFTDWQGIRGVAATFDRLPRPEDVILLHDAHWQGKGDLLLKLMGKLKEHCTVLPLSPVPRAARSIRQPS
jgi:peptidoglycan/xylan/chitin deacetylase (PgdA/CDA1 family)